MPFLPTAARTLRSSLAGDPWHGPSLANLVSDVTAEESAKRFFGAHSVLELVLHVAVWVEETASRLEGHPPVIPQAGDWPAPSSADPAEAWEAARSWLTRASDRLQLAVAAFPEGRLDDVVGGRPDSPPGSDVTFGATLIGLAEHNAYHAGQIALLKRAARARPEPELETRSAATERAAAPVAAPAPAPAAVPAAVAPSAPPPAPIAAPAPRLEPLEESALDAARRHIAELEARVGLGPEPGAARSPSSKPSREVADALARAELEALRARRARADGNGPDETPPLKKTL